MLSSVFQDSLRQIWAEEILSSIPDPLTFIEDPGFLNETLYPVQRFVVKLSYGIEIDGKNKIIEVRNDTNEEILYTFTEVEYLRYLYEEGRANWKEQKKEPNEIWLGIGRRGGKTLLMGHLSSYGVLKLLALKDPQSHYGISKKTDIGVVVVSTSRTQAQEMLKVASDDISDLPFLSYMSDPKLLGTILRFRLPENEAEDDEDFRPYKLNLSTFCMDSATSRGFSIIQLIFDEYAFFLNEKQKHTSYSVFDALVPSTGTFGSDFKIFYASSLGLKRGKFFDLHEQFFRPDSPALALRIPSWHMNYGLSPELLRSFKEGEGFSREFGSDYEGGYLKLFDPLKIEMCKTEDKIVGTRGRYFFMGSDLGLRNDWTSHCIITPVQGEIHVVEQVNFCSKKGEYVDVDTLDLGEMAALGESLFNKYRCRLGIFDQWQGFGYSSHLSPAMRKKYVGLNFNERLNHIQWSLLEFLILSNRLKVPEEFGDLLDELEDLVDISQKRDILKVETAGGESPDVSESLARAVLAMYKFLEEHPHLKVEFGLLDLPAEYLETLNASWDKMIGAKESIRSAMTLGRGVKDQGSVQQIRMMQRLGMQSNQAAFSRRLRRR